MFQIALFFLAEGFAVADEELKVPRVRFIDMGIINLIHDAVTQREPDAATGVVRRANAFFRTRGPARLNARRAECH
jgi:hypothetical protein